MSTPVFIADGSNGSAALVKKRRPKKQITLIEEDATTPTRQTSQPMQRDSSPRRVDSEDEGDFNPLADAMASSAAEVAAGVSTPTESVERAPVTAPSAASTAATKKKTKSNLAASLTSSASSPTNTASNDLIDAANAYTAQQQGYSHPSHTAPQYTSSAAATSTSNHRAPPRDEFDAALDAALSGHRTSGTTMTSSGYIDPSELAKIDQLQKRTQRPAQDEFEFEEVADVSNQSLAATNQPKSAARFDEFDDVWAGVESASSGGAPAGGRKVLKASKTQQAVEKPDAKEAARLKLEAELREAERIADEERREKERLEKEGLQNPLLAKLGMLPTNILAQYDTDKTKPTVRATDADKSKKPKREQDQLESNDEQLKAAERAAAAAAAAAAADEAAASSPRPVNVVESLVAAHTGVVVSETPIEEVEQWGAVNALREKQERAAAAEQERLARLGNQMGVKSEMITRDTPIHYDAALKALTVAPSVEPVMRATQDGASSSSSSSSPAPPSIPIQIQLLKQKIQIYDFRDIGMSRKMRYTLFPPKLKSARLEDERDLCFCMARMKIDYDHCVDHERILCSIYRGLTGDQLAPPTFGNHWQVIGWQGTDPSTDLRGSGLFSLIQLMWFMKHHKELMLKIYQLSLDDRQNFPFCTLSTNLTGMVLQALRECVIYGECRRQNSVYTVVHTLYVAAFYEMYLCWKNQNCTIASWNDIKQHIEKLVLRSPKALIAKFKQNQYAALGDGMKPDQLEFTEIP